MTRTKDRLTLNELDAENVVLMDQIARLESHLRELKLWLQQNNEETAKQLNAMALVEPIHGVDCTLCMGECI